VKISKKRVRPRKQKAEGARGTGEGWFVQENGLGTPLPSGALLPKRSVKLSKMELKTTRKGVENKREGQKTLWSTAALQKGVEAANTTRVGPTFLLEKKDSGTAEAGRRQGPTKVIHRIGKTFAPSRSWVAKQKKRTPRKAQDLIRLIHWAAGSNPANTNGKRHIGDLTPNRW